MSVLNKISIIRRISYWTMGVGVLIVVLIFLFIRLEFFKSTKEITENTIEIINENFAENVSAVIQKGVNITESVSAIASNSEMENTESFSDVFDNDFIRLFDKYESVKGSFIIKFRNSSNSSMNDSSLNDQLCYLRTASGLTKKEWDSRDFHVDFNEFRTIGYFDDIFFSEPYYYGSENKYDLLITIYKPLYKNNIFFGALGIAFSLKEVLHITNEQSYNQREIKRIILYQDKILAVTGKEFLSGKNIFSVEGDEHLIYNQLIAANYSLTDYNKKPVAYLKRDIARSEAELEFISVMIKDDILKDFLSRIITVIVIAVLFIFVGILIIIVFIKRSFAPLSSVSEILHKISLGEPVKIADRVTQSEFKKILEYSNKISDNIKHASDIGSKVAIGDYTQKMEMKSENDILSVSMNQIVDSLQRKLEETKKKEAEEYVQLWMRRGRFEVAETERKSDKAVDILTFNLIRKLVNYTGAVLGGIYLLNDDTSGLILTAAYAYGNKKHVQIMFKPGEGLAGACLIEKKKILLSNIPDDYITVSSGLGSGTPGYLALIPVFFQERINAIIEIAYIKKPEEYIIMFIEQLSDNIGAWINSSVSGAKTEKLLEVSKDQTKELENKEAELNTKVEELERVQAETAVQNADFRSMMNAVNNTVMTVEYTLEGIVLNSNTTYEKIMGWSINDIKGVNVLDLVKDQQSDLREIINEVAKGTHIKRQVKRYTKDGGVKWLSATYTPYIDPEGNITRVLFFAFDITDMKTELEKLKS